MNTQIAVDVMEVVRVEDLKPAPFNPPTRVEEKRIKKLQRAIERAGEIIVPIVITTDNFIADGHRRVTIAKKLEMPYVKAIRKEWTLADLWANLNCGVLSPTRVTWMQAVAEGMPIEYVEDLEAKRQIEILIRVVGDRMFQELAQKGRSPWIGQNAIHTANYCGEGNNDEFCRKTIIWFETHGTQNAARDAITAQCPPDVLLAAINDNRPIRQFWGIA
jgi:hypothetical protein